METVFRFKNEPLGKAFLSQLKELGYTVYKGYDWGQNLGEKLTHKAITITNDKYGVHNHDCSHTRKHFQLETEYQEALEFAQEQINPTFKDGDWFAVDGCEDNETWIGRYPDRYEYKCGGTWEYNDSFLKKEARKATDKEIEQVLITEAKRRGFKEGVLFNSLQNGGMKCKGNKRYSYLSNFNKLQFGTLINYKDLHGVIYEKGKWAEIIETTIFNWKVEQHDKTTKIGCKTFANNFLIDFNDALEQLNGDTTAREIIAELEKLDYIDNSLPF